ncbi:MAG: hypothetical protein AAB573_01540 [Patescibacteria group bacterium]
MAEGKKIEGKGRILEASQSVWRSRLAHFAHGLTLNVSSAIAENRSNDYKKPKSPSDGAWRAAGVLVTSVALAMFTGIAWPVWVAASFGALYFEYKKRFEKLRSATAPRAA